MNIEKEREILETIESFDSPNSTLECEAHLKEKGRTTNLSI